mmetsp:Transcript_49917/g.159728  ORF Transcript_49917/g.159728 Transcript_49917/m.159728 type:complete len:162 (+) Transcript_49917:393-878(+)
MYNERYGEEKVVGMVENVTKAMDSHGLTGYSLGGLTGNTFNSHRLLALAGAQGAEVQAALAEELFRAYFLEAKFLNDPEVLLAAAKAAGLDNAEAVVRDEAEGTAEALEQLGEAKKEGVTGVPLFVIEGPESKLGRPVSRLRGAHPPDAFAEIFSEVLAKI